MFLQMVLLFLLGFGVGCAFFVITQIFERGARALAGRSRIGWLQLVLGLIVTLLIRLLLIPFESFLEWVVDYSGGDVNAFLAILIGGVVGFFVLLIVRMVVLRAVRRG